MFATGSREGRETTEWEVITFPNPWLMIESQSKYE